MPPTAESEEGMDVTRAEEGMEVAAAAEEEEQEEQRGGRKRGKAPSMGKEKGERPAKKRHSDASSSAAASSEDGGGSEGSGSAREEDDEDDEEDEALLREDADGARLGPRAAVNMPGQTAETGVIAKIYCENFMCHRKLSVTLCPHVNFINGQNGSGKSAILAALQICLGARANVTHRGSKLSDLIRQGHNGAALVRVSLLNKGTDPFKPQLYGDYITVERKIERNGSSTYGLLKGNPHRDNPTFTVVTRSKEELVSMLDAFNIQIDNPCALLDQENAKRFIQGDAKEKYSFFEKATDIERVRNCINQTVVRLDKTADALAIQMEEMPKVEEVWKDLEKLRLDMESLESIEEDIKRARVELAWVIHRGNLDETKSIADEVVKVEKQIKKLMEAVDKAEEEKKQKMEASSGVDDAISSLREQVADAKRTMKELKQQIRVLTEKVKTADKAMKDKTEEIKSALRTKKDAQAKMVEERAKLASKAQKEIGPKVERVRKIEDELEAANQDMQKGHQEYEALRNDRATLVERDADIVRKMHQLKAEKSDLDNEKRRLGSAQGKLAGYGAQIDNLVKELEKPAVAQRFKSPPLGPLGQYVTVRNDSQEWAGPVENAIGGGMVNFVVAHHEDRRVLQDLCKRFNCAWITIVTMPPGQGKYRVREPTAQGIKSVAQCVAVEHDIVWNALVDWAKIDTSAVFRTHKEAHKALIKDQRGHRAFPMPIKSAYHLDNFQTDALFGGTIMTRPVNGGKFGRRLGVDKSQLIQNVEHQIAEKVAAYKALDQELGGARARIKELDAKMRALKTENGRLHRTITTLRHEKEGLDEEIREAEAEGAGDSATQTGQLDDLTYEVEQAEEVIKEAQAEQARLNEMKRALEEELKPLQDKQANEAKRNKEMDKRLGHEEGRMESNASEIEEAMGKVKKLQNGLQNAEAGLAGKRKELEEAEAQDAANLERLKQYTQQQLPDWDGEEVEPEETKVDLQKRIKKMESRKAREAEKHGTSDSIEVIREKEKRAKEAYKRMYRDIQKITKARKALQEALDTRQIRMRALRKYIVRRSTQCFDQVLEKRGQTGKLDFSHKEHTLSLEVQKDAKDETTRSTNVKELSGGERSFSTLALLLALGESIESPFRAMDEFDIFMDAVSRKAALNKLIETARSEEMRHRQFIFITPQDLSGVQKYVGDDFKIHKLRPPEREDRGLQQTTLN